MARFARVVAVEVAHHVTQRGNARQFILNGDADRQVYLGLLRESIEEHRASLMGYCLMSNHVHLVMVPHQADALATAFAGKEKLRAPQTKLAQYVHAVFNSSHLTTAQQQMIFDGVQKILNDGGASPDETANVVNDIKTIASETK